MAMGVDKIMTKFWIFGCTYRFIFTAVLVLLSAILFSPKWIVNISVITPTMFLCTVFSKEKKQNITDNVYTGIEKFG